MADEKGKPLEKLQQEEFCQLDVSKEFFGNGVETYLEVYDIDRTKPNWYKTACSAASRLLSNVRVAERINQLLDEAGLNDSHVDKQLLFLITQHADFTRKLGAIIASSEYQGVASGTVSVTVRYKMTAGTTSSTTFRLRVGGNDAGTLTFNGQAGIAKFGGITISNIKITEYWA